MEMQPDGGYEAVRNPQVAVRRPDGMVTIAPGVYTSMPPWSQKCHSCGHYTDHDDNLSLHYVRSDGVPGMSYPMCRGCRPEQISRLVRMGFTDIEAR